MGKKDSAAGVILFLLFGWSFMQATSFPERSAAFPKVISIAGMLLSVILIVRSFVGKNKNADKEMFNSKQKKMILLMTGLIILYAVLINFVGFVIATIVFILVSGFLLYPEKITADNKKPVIMIVACAFILTLLIWYVFKNLLYVPLPAGALFK